MLTFPEIIDGLITLDVESYYADYRKGETSYYTKQGQSYAVEMHKPEGNIPLIFNPAELQAAIRASQRDEIRYQEFTREIQNRLITKSLELYVSIIIAKRNSLVYKK